MRIAGLGLKTDFHRDLLEVLGRETRFLDAGTDALHVAFADREVHINRRKLDDGGECRRPACSNELPQRDLARRHDAVEGRLDLRVAEVELGLLDIGRCLLLLGHCGGQRCGQLDRAWLGW